MNFETIEDILDFAIQREKSAVAFYLALSKKENVPSLKQTFRDLAREEEQHIKMINDLKKDTSIIESYEQKEVSNLKISDYMLEVEYYEGMLMEDILTLAMKREEKATKLYLDLAELASTDDTRKLFQLFAQEEAQHKLFFEKMYDDLLNEGGN